MTSTALSKQNALSQAAFKRYVRLDTGGKVIATYLFVCNLPGGGERLLSKKKVISLEEASSVDKVPIWDIPTPKDQHITGCGIFEDKLVPIKIYKDPFLGPPNIMVLCHVLKGNKKPSVNNNRPTCKEALDKAASFEPWFGFEQEYFFRETDGQLLGWPKHGYPPPMGPSYCNSGPTRAPGSRIVDSHMKACLYSGLNIYGSMGELCLGQWEFQTGPTPGIDAADELWVARYILCRVAEDFGVDVTFNPAPIVNTSDWMGSGCHSNISTNAMRDPETGIRAMEEACEKLKVKHDEHMKKYDRKNGEENKIRLGDGYNKFTWGYENRKASIRIPEPCKTRKCGYIEDRRPSSNCDPYLVAEMLIKTICLDE